jgi:hypothetical protein
VKTTCPSNAFFASVPTSVNIALCTTRPDDDTDELKANPHRQN